MPWPRPFGRAAYPRFTEAGRGGAGYSHQRLGHRRSTLPDHPIAQALLKSSQLPLAAPSANMFGRISPTCVQHIGEQFADFDAMVLDGEGLPGWPRINGCRLP